MQKNFLPFIHQIIVENDSVTAIKDTKEIPDVSKTIYEIFKIVAGKPVFITDHLYRLQQSLKKIKVNYLIDLENIRHQIEQLCQSNNIYFGNMELRLSILENNDIISYLGFIKHHYPEPNLYLRGIDTKVVKIVRENPTLKIKNTTARQKANRYIAEHNLYEVLLENEENLITEGSRSNLFFIKNEVFFTAPDNTVLHGISRLNIIRILQNMGCSLIYKSLSKNELKDFQAAFICGTSPGILPIRKIDNVIFDVNNKKLRMLILEFNKWVSNYLNSPLFEKNKNEKTRTI